MISRYRVGPRRVVIAASIPVSRDDGGSVDVPLVDMAVDLDASDLKAYRDSLWDTKHLFFVEGEQPTWWTIHPLTRRQKDAAEGMTPRQRAAFYIRCSVSKVENYPLIEEDGTRAEIAQPKRKQNGSLGIMAQESWVDKLDLPEEYLHAFAHMIRVISEAGDPLASKSEPPSGPGKLDEKETTEQK